MKNLEELLEHEIQDLYSAESQLVEALPKMLKAANDSKLKMAFENHIEETKHQKKRLEKVAEMLSIRPDGEKCKGMEGLIMECEKMIKEDADTEVKDAGLIGTAQKVEHYEIAGYGTARQFAEMLGKREIANLLSETLEEEKDADEIMTDLAVEKINKMAMA